MKGQRFKWACFGLLCICVPLATVADGAASNNAASARPIIWPVDRMSPRLRAAMITVEQYVARGESAKARSIVASEIKASLTAPALRRLGAPDCRLLLSMARLVDDRPGERQLAGAWVRWLKARADDPRVVRPTDLLALARSLRETDAGAGQLGTIGDYAERRLIGDVSSKALSVADWCALHELGGLTGADRVKDAATARLTRINSLSAAVTARLSAHDIGQLAAHYRRLRDAGSVQRLAVFVADDYLRRPGLADALRSDEWLALMRLAESADSDAVRRRLAQFIEQRMQHGRMPVAVMSRLQMQELRSALLRLRGAAAAASAVHPADRAVALWLGVDERWNELSGGLRASLINAAIGSAGSLVKLDGSLSGPTGQGASTWVASWAVGRTAWRLNNRKVAQQGAWLAFDRLTSTDAPDPKAMADAASLLARTGATTNDKRIRQLIGMIGGWADRAHQFDDTVYRDLARLLHTDAGRRALGKALGADAPRLNLALVRVRAWLARMDGAIRRYVGDLTALRKGLTGDDLAHLELARAYATSIIRDGAVCRTDGNATIHLALRAAQTEAMRLRCIEELVAACRAAEKYDAPLPVIASMEAQFSGAARQRLQSLTAQLTRDSAAFSARRTESKALTGKRWYWTQVFSDARRAQR